MPKYVLDCVNRFSNGAKQLARLLNAKRIKATGSRYKARPTDVIINWGHSSPRVYAGRRYYGYRVPSPLNPPDAVASAVDKLATLRKLAAANVNTPEFTDSVVVARTWVKEGHLICSRALLRASEGRGMVVTPEPQEAVGGLPTKLWTKYVRGREFRIHVFKGKAIDAQVKKHRRETEAVSTIRNKANGWVFCREGINQLPEIELVKTLAVQGCQAVGLDFGAVDIRYNAKKKKAVILEINTTPGLEGTTLTSYANAIRGLNNEAV